MRSEVLPIRSVDVRREAHAVVEVARGMLLLGVFHVHAVYAVIEHLRDPVARSLGLVQIQFLTAHVVLFFALSGMTSRWLADKPTALVVQRSLWLWLLAVASHLVGVLLEYAMWKPWGGVYPLLRDLGKPIVLGTNWSTFGWFFVVLAAVRLFVLAWARDRRIFVAAALAVAAVAAAAMARGWSDNLIEWRYWPPAFALFLIGMRLRAEWRVPHWVGLSSAAVGLALPAFNHPTLWTDGPCLACHADFLIEPMVGRWGALPLFGLQVGASLLALLWLAQVLARGASGRFLAYVGRRSFQLLVLHGWICLTVYGLAAYLPLQLQLAGPWLFAVMLVLNPWLHVALYRLLRWPLDGLVALCAKASRGLIRRALQHPRV